MKCDICGKVPQTGYNISHSKRHTKRKWLGNIHPATIIVEGKAKRVTLCTRCIRTRHKLTPA